MTFHLKPTNSMSVSTPSYTPMFFPQKAILSVLLACKCYVELYSQLQLGVVSLETDSAELHQWLAKQQGSLLAEESTDWGLELSKVR